MLATQWPAVLVLGPADVMVVKEGTVIDVLRILAAVELAVLFGSDAGTGIGSETNGVIITSPFRFENECERSQRLNTDNDLLSNVNDEGQFGKGAVELQINKYTNNNNNK